MENNAPENLKFVSQVREQMSKNKLMLSYRGEISQEIIMALLNLTENKINQSSFDASIRSRVFGVMVECLQNITQHCDQDKNSSMFMIGSSGNGYMIYSGNVIQAGKVEELKNKITRINTMTEEELKEFYKYWIKIESLSGETGAGLGLIHIARKTGNSLDFDFEPIDEEHYFFSLRTLVDH